MSATEQSSTKPVIEDRIYIGNVDYKATEEELKEFYQDFKVTDVDIPSTTRVYGKKTVKRHLGFAFVQFESKEEADKAIEFSNGKQFKNRDIYIKKAVPPPTEEEKEQKKEAYRAKQAELKKSKTAEKKAAKTEATPAKTESSETTAEKPKVKAAPEGTPSKDTIFITNLDYKVDVQTLSNHFKDLKPKWIHVPTVRVPYRFLQKQKASGKPLRNKGIAFVKFSSEEAQKQAIAEYTGNEINGRQIVIDIAIDTREDKPEEAEVTEVTEKTDA